MGRDQPNLDPEMWVDAYGDYLYKYALLRLKDPMAAQDAVQETLLAGFKGLDRFDGRVDIKFWLRGILRNKIVDYIRKAVRERPIENIEEYEPPDSVLYAYSGITQMRPKKWQFDPEEVFKRKEFMEIFHDCLSKLKGPMQQAFTLKELEGISTKEICEVMDITPNNLWVMLHRARNQLKDCLEKKWISTEPNN